MAKNYFTESEVEDILREVETAINSATSLSKNLKKDDGSSPKDDDDQAPPMPANAAPGGDAGAPPGGDAGMDDGAGAPPPDDAGAPPPEGEMSQEGAGAPPPDDAGMDDGTDEGDQQLEQEGQDGEDGELSDQELHQIYSTMEPAELERHYMVIRACLRDQYQKSEHEETRQKEEGGMKESKKKEMKKKMQEQEQTISNLTKSVKEMEESLGGAMKAIELIAKPIRKAVVADHQVLAKSEESKEVGPALTKAEITAQLNQKVKENLTKSERQTINSYVLSKNEEGRDAVLAILGGKK